MHKIFQMHFCNRIYSNYLVLLVLPQSRTRCRPSRVLERSGFGPRSANWVALA